MKDAIVTYCINQDKISYRDYADDSPFIDKYYEIANPYAVSCIAVPDRTINIQCIWKDGKCNVVIAGCLSRGSISALSDADLCFGMRLKPNRIPVFLKNRMEDIIANRIPIEEFIDVPDEMYLLKESMDFNKKIEYMKKAFSTLEFEGQGELVDYIVSKLVASCGCINIEQLTESTGYGHRHINNIFKNITGMSIKKYACILRMQSGIRYLLENRVDDIYSTLHYYDQSHFIHDFKNFTTYTPSKFQKLMECNTIRIV